MSNARPSADRLRAYGHWLHLVEPPEDDGGLIVVSESEMPRKAIVADDWALGEEFWELLAGTVVWYLPGKAVTVGGDVFVEPEQVLCVEEQASRGVTA